ncbi:MAG TPA: GMC family oxidoreductase N-terminal domain-containing protein [candidate division Zixibacteria bacterium]|nr:GMC family oxidoreductase N-terminal domain-containing protein [candidate division Zixibacteria bacterium]
MTIRKQTDVVIVGSGPGGANLARELALSDSGLGITLLERGRDWRDNPLYGTYPGAIFYSDKGYFLRSREGLTIIRPLMLGGATSMYCGCSAMPGPWWREKYDIDLEEFATQTARELKIAPLAPELRGEASTRIAEAAAELGMEWEPQEKFLQPSRAESFDCDAKCMLGCRCGAKWNAAEYVDQAVADGCDLWTGAKVHEVLHSGGTVQGVKGRIGRKDFIIEAGTVVISAGGIGTPMILQQSGLPDAGRGMTMDTTSMVYGHAPYKGSGYDPPMTWSYADDELGAMYSTLIDPWLVYPIAMITKGPAYTLSWRRWGRTLGVMIKLKDEISGGIGRDGRINKGLTSTDRKKQDQAHSKATEILVRADCDPDSIFVTPLRGTHPSGTVRIDTMLSRRLESEITGLYVCDASVFPEALGSPTVLTIISLAKRLADHLIHKAE